MEKTVIVVKGECITSNGSKEGGNITIADGIVQTEKGTGAKTAVNIVVPDVEASGKFMPGKRYTVTVTEDS